MLILILILLKKENYATYFGYVAKLSLEKELKELVSCITKLYQAYPEKGTFTVEELELFFFTQKGFNPKDKELYYEIFDRLRRLPVLDEVVTDVLSSIKQQAIAGELAVSALSVAQGQGSFEDLRSLFDQLSAPSTASREEGKFVTDDLEELYGQTIATPGLRWRLQALNRSLGSLRRGDFGFIFARPETGKTTFLASEVTFFATQTANPILWFNNEEQGNKVMIRCYQAALGVQLHDLMSDRAGNQERYRETTGSNIRLYDSATIQRSDVERIVSQFDSVALIIFDQIDKLRGFEDDRDDLRLGQIYIWARELAKSRAPVIGVTQASGSAEGKKWLTMDDVANAKTSKQAEADWILGIGKTHDEDLAFVRHLNICKNKLSGDQDTDPTMRHGKLDVIIKPEIARYEDLL